jgi:hypothetical protein
MKAISSVSRSTRSSAASKLMGSTRSMAAGKEIRFGVEGRAAMLRGVDLLADAVQVRFVFAFILRSLSIVIVKELTLVLLSF